MRRYDLGDAVTLRHEVRDPLGALTAATVTLTIERPEDATDYTATVTTPSTGLYTATVPADELDTLGVYAAVWRVSGAVEDVDTVSFYVDDEVPELPPLASVERLGRKLGYLPEGGEYIRAAHILDEASELIRDKASRTWTTDAGALEDVPRAARVICIAAAFRAFTNPEALSQRSIGDSSKSYDRAGLGGGEAVYLTDEELRRIRKAAGSSSWQSVTLVSAYGSGAMIDPWDQVTAQ